MAPVTENDLKRVLLTLAHGVRPALLWRLELGDLHRLVEALHPVSASPRLRPLLLALCRMAHPAAPPLPLTEALAELEAQREEMARELVESTQPARRAVLERRIRAMDALEAEIVPSVLN